MPRRAFLVVCHVSICPRSYDPHSCRPLILTYLSRLLAGTVFKLHAAYILSVPVKPDSATHQHTRILFFDDDADILELCSIILRTRGYEVYTRNSCDHVEDSVAEVAPDIIFMDGRIPDIGGVEATRRLKAHTASRNIPVVFFSANADVNYLSTQAGADAYLPKPFDISELETVIRRTLSAGGIRASA